MLYLVGLDSAGKNIRLCAETKEKVTWSMRQRKNKEHAVENNRGERKWKSGRVAQSQKVK